MPSPDPLLELELSIDAERSEAMATRARRDDPHTSHEAAARASKLAAEHCAAITGAMWRGMTAYEVAKLTGLTSVQVSRRLPELAEAGLVRKRQVGGTEADPVYETRPGDTGRACIVWERIDSAFIR